MGMARTNRGKPFADHQLTRMIRESAYQAWQSGRSAYSRVGSESSRLAGSVLSIGERIDREAKSRVFEARASAAQAWDRLESAFVHRVARALNALQIPTARDVHELNSRVEALQKAIVALERRAVQASPPRSGTTSRGKAPARRQPAVRAAGKAPLRARTSSGT
jgi:poly(hydroxyalkanoate) granule-associated protein